MNGDGNTSRGEKTGGPRTAPAPGSPRNGGTPWNPPKNIFLYLSKLLGRRVLDEKGGRSLGRFYDAEARIEESYPRLTRLFIRSRRPLRSIYRGVPWSAVKKCGEEGIVVDSSALLSVPVPAPAPGEVLLREDVLDQQIVDVAGAKLVRVNDVHLLQANGEVRVAHVDIGTRGLMRRLGFERSFTAFVRWLFGYEMKECLVSWKHVHLILEPEESPHRGTKLSLAGRLTELHPADLADIMEELDPRTREVVFQSLPLDTAAEALEETEIDVQKGLIEAVAEEKAADILEQMSSPAAADLLGDLTQPQREEILDEMDLKKAATVRELLVHPDETAGGLMTNSIVRLLNEKTADEALQVVRRNASNMDIINYLFSVDAQGRLRGVVTLKELFRSSPDTPLDQILTRKLISVAPETEKDEVFRLFSKYGLRAIPVVDAEGVLRGAVRFRAFLSAVSPELS